MTVALRNAIPGSTNATVMASTSASMAGKDTKFPGLEAQPMVGSVVLPL